MNDMSIVFAILGLTIVLFVSGRLPSDLVAIGSMLGLYLTGVLSLPQAFAGFSNSTVILVGSLFVVGEAMTRTGVTAFAGERLIQSARGRPLRLLVVLMVGTAVLSAFVSNTGTVATLMPAVILAAWGVKSVPSAFLMPLAFAANAGGVLTLTGTPPNVVVAEALESHGYEPFAYFEYAYIGLPLLVVAVVYMAVVGQRLLPQRTSGSAPRPLDSVLAELAESYELQGGTYRLRVLAGSPLIGTDLAESGLASEYGLTVLRLVTHEGNFTISRGFSEAEHAWLVSEGNAWLAQLRAQKDNPQFDVVHFSGGLEHAAAAEGLLSPIKAEELSNYDQMYAFAGT